MALFGLRLIYGYLYEPGETVSIGAGYVDAASIVGAVGGRESLKKNYASEKLKVERPGEGGYSVDQKYEKVGSIDIRSQAFEDDEKKVREMTVRYGALIQYEQSSGLKGSRRLGLAIGVNPLKKQKNTEHSSWHPCSSVCIRG